MFDRSSTHASFLLRLKDGGDSLAWDEFYSRYGELIRNFARRRGLQSADADDIVQDVMMAVRNVMPTFEYSREKGRFRGFLKTVALRAVWARARRLKDDPAFGAAALAAAESDRSIDDEWETEWRQYHMRTALDRVRLEFGAEDVRAFRMYALEGATVEATSAALSISTDRVYLAKTRVLKRLRALISEQTADEG